MSKPGFPFWDKDETNNDTPPTAKQAAGNKSTRPEAATSPACLPN